MNAIRGYAIADRIKGKCPDCRKAADYAEALHIEIIHFDLVNLKAMYSAADRHRTIFLNQRLGGFAKEFCTFHEIAHDQIPEHRQMARASCIREIEFFGTDAMKNMTEYEANAVAAHLYINEEELKEYLISERQTVWEAARLLNAPADLVIIKLMEMQRAKRFNGRVDLSADPCFLKKADFEEDDFWGL